MKPIERTYKEIMDMYDPANNMTRPVLSKYEATSIVGSRSEQLANGAPTVLTEAELGTMTSVRDIAIKELKLKKIPLMIARDTGSGTEYWKISDMVLLNNIA